MRRSRPTEMERQRRARRKHERRQQRRLIDDLVPPEGVPLTFRIAGLGERIAAQLADLLLTGLFGLVLMAFLAVAFDPPGTLLITLFVLLFFFLRTPYYVLTELLWNGQTLGKRMLKLRVVSGDGRSLTTHAIVVRNLMKEAEVFVPGTLLLAAKVLDPVSFGIMVLWVAVALAIPLFSRRRQRLGDRIANTYVIHQPQAVLLPDLVGKGVSQPVKTAGEAGFVFLPHQLDHYGAFELQTLEQVLHGGSERQTQSAGRRRAATLAQIVERIRAKVDYADPVPEADSEAFLRAFYTAQRRHLEKRQLMGERRADKFHRDESG